MIELAMQEELTARPEAVALACMDTRSGLLLGLEARSDAAREVVEVAALSAAELCSAPAPSFDGTDAPSDDALVVSPRWVHAYARVPTRRDVVMVGVAPGDANVALLRAWIRGVAARVGPQS